MTVEIKIKWRIVGDGDYELTYSTPAPTGAMTPPERQEKEPARIHRLLPAGSSLVAPGLSRHVS
jgi:hypothetical protein